MTPASARAAAGVVAAAVASAVIVAPAGTRAVATVIAAAAVATVITAAAVAVSRLQCSTTSIHSALDTAGACERGLLL